MVYFLDYNLFLDLKLGNYGGTNGSNIIHYYTVSSISVSEHSAIHTMVDTVKPVPNECSGCSMSDSSDKKKCHKVNSSESVKDCWS